MGATPKWAHLHQPAGEDEEEALLEKSTGDYLARGKSAKLDKKRLDFKKQVDLNHASRTEGAIIAATEFNPKYNMALVAGFSSTVVGAASLFKNVLVSPDGELLVFIGKNGQLHLFDADCLSLVDTLYASGDVTSAAFNSDGSRLYTHTIEGDVYIWDMHARACIHRYYDDGCIGGTSIAVSPNNQYLACGSSSGVVSVYDLANVMSSSPSPVKVLTRLRSSVSTLAFNSSSEILATVSNQVENAIKLIMSIISEHRDPGYCTSEVT
ncbi:U3 small nucleolar RNA-associated protein 18 [Portunus trituberculatus]|uniref:U3 small nucleolar RNA-associated protein 18 n=1 Tax=Portunus trituberculatus TaxID=210409 RepID=A0A5B7EZU6_PORTR|nr:U3 small nucleolar RNA-associated protein 18 [Portunus trituberculatus]